MNSNDYDWIQSINSVETYAYGVNKEATQKKEEIKRNNIIKQYKKWLTLLYQKRYQRTYSELGHIHKLLVIHKK